MTNKQKYGYTKHGDNSKTFSACLPTALFVQLKAVCAADKISLNGVIQGCLERWLADYKRNKELEAIFTE